MLSPASVLDDEFNPGAGAAAHERPARSGGAATDPEYPVAPMVTLGESAKAYAFLHTDHLGSVRLSELYGEVIARHDFLPFGEEVTPVFDENTHLYTGHERDIETGLDYMLARYCSATLGRFVSVDLRSIVELQNGAEEDEQRFETLIRDPANWNGYSYVSNSPLGHFDPDGREAATALLTTEVFLYSGGGAAAFGGATLAGGAALLAGAAIGYGINNIPAGEGETVGSRISEALANVFFAGKANDARQFIDAKVTTVLQHIGRYGAPDPNDPDDQKRKKGIGNRMQKHIEAAKDKLKGLKGKSQQECRERIQRAEELLHEWIGGENPPNS